jgi:hypothetical protein
MLEVARRKAADAGVSECVTFRQVDVRDLRRWDPGFVFDGMLSNFGVLNCVSDWQSVGTATACWMRPGARAVLVVMGPLCPWEIGWHILHGEVGRALRRFRAGEEARLEPGTNVVTWYPSPRRLRAAMAEGEAAPFRHVETMGIGALLPPTDLHHLVDRWPALFEALAALEGRWRTRFPWTWLNDHYLMVLERARS